MEFAEKYCKDAIEQGCTEIVDPTKWLRNQSSMRKSWEEYKKAFSNSSNNEQKVFNKTLLNNEFARYMNFMYDNYPEGFGEKIHEHAVKGEDMDGAKIYMELSGMKV